MRVELKTQPRIAESAPGTPEREYLNIETAASLVSVSDATIRRMLTQRKLTRYKFGARTLIRRNELLEKIQPEAQS
jgi:excisionase family DNA binding protein